MLSLKLKVPLTVVVAMILFTAGLLYIDYQGKLELIELNKQSTLESLVKQFNSEIELTTQDAEARAELIANISSIKKLFRQGVEQIEDGPKKIEPPKVDEDGNEIEAIKPEKIENFRQQLIDELHDTYQVQSAKYGAVQAQFHRPPAWSYYRLHDKLKNDDDLKNFRFTVLEVNDKKQVFSGPEIGRSGLGIRGVVPVDDEEGHIGSFEFGLRFKPILDRLKASHDVEISLFLDASPQKNITWEKWHDEAGDDIGTFKHIFSTDSTHIASLLDAQTLIGATEQQRFDHHIGKKKFGVILSPLKDFSGKRIGVFAIAKDFSEFEQIVALSIRNALLLFSLGIILLVLLLFGLLHFMILGPIAQITRAADRVSLGDLEEPMILERKDEVGQLSESFERMRVSLSKAMQALEEEE